MHSSVVRVVLLAMICAALLPSSSAQAFRPFAVRQRIVVGGDGSWDYMTFDKPSHRLYLAHETQVDVIDLGTGKVAGSIKGLTRCHGVVLLDGVDGARMGYISDGGANRIVIFDPATFATLGNIAVGKNPDGLLYEASTRTLWAFNGAGKDASVIDPVRRKVIATIALPGKPEFPATDDAGNIYVNIVEKPSIVHLDANSRTAKETWPLQGCEDPSGLALDREGGRLFSVCDGKAMAITDAHNGKSLAVAHVGVGPDAAAYYPAGKLAFASNGDGTLSVIDTSKPGYPTVQTLPTMTGARTMALDPDTGTVYTVSAQFGPMPKPIPGSAHTRRTPIPGTFTVLAISR